MVEKAGPALNSPLQAPTPMYISSCFLRLERAVPFSHSYYADFTAILSLSIIRYMELDLLTLLGL